MKFRIVLSVIMLWAVASFAQFPAKDGVLLQGEFVRNIGVLDLDGWGVGGDFNHVNIRGLSISVGQLCGTNPDTGALITEDNNLIPSVFRTLNVKHDAEFVNGNVGINTSPSGVTTEKLKVAGSIQSTLGGSAGGYMFADTTDARRESRLETAYALVPIGAVVAFYKYPGVKALPGNFKECDGTSVSDVDSPMNGLAVPNLNGQAATIEGNAGGAGGFVGANIINLTEAQMPAHDHDGLTGWEAVHNHTGSTGQNGNHTHTAASMSDPGGHTHSVRYQGTTEHLASGGLTGYHVWEGDSSPESGWGGSHTHSFTTTNPGNHPHSISNDGAHDHEITSKGSNANVDNRQRSCQLTWIIRIK